MWNNNGSGWREVHGVVWGTDQRQTLREKKERDRDRERERWGGEKHPAKEREKNDSENMAMEKH